MMLSLLLATLVPTAEFYAPYQSDTMPPEILLPKFFSLKPSTFQLWEGRAFFLEGHPSVHFSKWTLPMVPIEAKKIETPFQMRRDFKLELESFPNDAYRWGEDILSALVLYEDKQVGDKMLHKSRDASFDSLLNHFLASSSEALLKQKRYKGIEVQEISKKILSLSRPRTLSIYKMAFFSSLAPYFTYAIPEKQITLPFSHTFYSPEEENYTNQWEFYLVYDPTLHLAHPIFCHTIKPTPGAELSLPTSAIVFHEVMPFSPAFTPCTSYVVEEKNLTRFSMDTASHPVEEKSLLCLVYYPKITLPYKDTSFKTTRFEYFDPSTIAYMDHPYMNKKISLFSSTTFTIPPLSISEMHYTNGDPMYSLPNPSICAENDVESIIPMFIPSECKVMLTPYLPFAHGRVLFEELPLALRSKHSENYDFYAWDHSQRLNRMHRFINYHLEKMPSLMDLNTDSLGSEFRVEARIVPFMKSSGYIVALLLRPQEDSYFMPMKEHFYFLIDSSSNIEQHRFDVFKNAVTTSLRYLPEHATFNIVLFDQKAEGLSQEELRPNKASLEFVKKNLPSALQSKASHFSALYTILESLKEKARNSQDVYTVVLLSNGHLMKNIRYHRDALYQLIKNKPQNLNIHTAAISDKNNTPMLELLANLGGGGFIYSQTHSSFPRKFAAFMKKHSSPIARDIHIYPISHSLDFVHNKELAPLFFQDKPYVFYGKTDNLADLDLIIQGHTGARYFNIRKHIKLSEAPKGKTTYERTLSSKLALDAMIHFILTNDPSSLLAAKQLLASYDVPLPFK